VAGAADHGADPARPVADMRNGEPMVNLVRFGRKLKIPSTAQIKHELLLLWLKDQTAKEAAEARRQDQPPITVRNAADPRAA
jgi:hypothetical protein